MVRRAWHSTQINLGNILYHRYLHDVLKKHDRILIDTNSFIYLVEDNELYVDLLQTIFDMIESGKVFGITTTLVLTEVLTNYLVAV